MPGPAVAAPTSTSRQAKTQAWPKAQPAAAVMEPLAVGTLATAVSANEAKIARVMRELRAKLEMLAGQTECPVCLERLSTSGAAPATTLGCAHRVCHECWRHWSATCRSAHKAPYCPICRQDEFIGDVMAGTPQGTPGV